MPHPLCVSGGMEREMRRCARINEISLVYSLDPHSKVNLRIVEDTLPKLQINVVSIFFFSFIFFYSCVTIFVSKYSSAKLLVFVSCEWVVRVPPPTCRVQFCRDLANAVGVKCSLCTYTRVPVRVYHSPSLVFLSSVWWWAVTFPHCNARTCTNFVHLVTGYKTTTQLMNARKLNKFRNQVLLFILLNHPSF